MQNQPQPMEATLEDLVEEAKAGNRQALEELVRGIQDRIYGLSLRMLYDPADAEDACQEILIKVITHLDSFEGRSSFPTWAYRVAANHLLTTRQRRAEALNLSFEYFDKAIDKSRLSSGPAGLDEGERSVLVNEAKLICTNAMLLALRRDIRLAFIIGEIFGASGQEGAEILEITPEAFRQRLSRGRKQIRDFMVKTCGLVVPGNPCQCGGLVQRFIKVGWLDPSNPRFSNHPYRSRPAEPEEPPLEELDEFGRITAVFRSHPDYAAPEAFVDIIRKLVDSGRFQLLTAH